MDWRVTSGSLVILIAVFAIIWSRVQINWEGYFRSLYESVADDTPLIDNIWDVHLDDEKNSLIYVKEECSTQDTVPFFLHLVPVDRLDLPASRREFTFDNLDFDFEEYGFHLSDICIAEVNLPGYDIVRLRTGQYVGRFDQLTNLWGEEAAVGQEQ